MDYETYIDSAGVEFIVIEKAPSEFVTMPKAVWDEQQKAAELGGTL